jgi:hypothetical protein
MHLPPTASEQEVTARLYETTWDAERSPHPDGLGIWAEQGRDICFLLEYDTGSEHLTQFADKLPGYAEHAQRSLAFKMPILFCFPTPRREQTARKAIAATAASLYLQIATAALDPRVPARPAGRRGCPCTAGTARCG